MKTLMSILICFGLFFFTSCGDTSTQNNRGMQDEGTSPGMEEGTTAGTTGTTTETEQGFGTEEEFESDTTTTTGGTTAGGTTGTTDDNMNMESDTTL